MRHESHLFDLLSRWSAALFLMRLTGGPLPAPEPDAFGKPSKAASQLVWLGLVYRERTTPPTYRISHRGKEAVQVMEELTAALKPLAEHSYLRGRNEFAELTYKHLVDLLRHKPVGVVPA